MLTVEQRTIRSRKSLKDAVMRSYDCRRNIATGPTKIQAAFLAAVNER
jgi:hypothetical protein